MAITSKPIGVAKVRRSKRPFKANLSSLCSGLRASYMPIGEGRCRLSLAGTRLVGVALVVLMRLFCGGPTNGRSSSIAALGRAADQT